MVTERRHITVPFKLEQRDNNSDGMSFRGYAVVFDSPSEDLGGFVEYVARGAIRKALGRSPDVRLLHNHNEDYVLASAKNSTLRLSEDPTGLYVEADIIDTTYGEDVAKLIKRGDIDQMSFAFTVAQDEWVDATDSGLPVRRILEVGSLFDVSTVTYPAYPATSAAMRQRLLAGDVVGETVQLPDGLGAASNVGDEGRRDFRSEQAEVAKRLVSLAKVNTRRLGVTKDGKSREVRGRGTLET